MDQRLKEYTVQNKGVFDHNKLCEMVDISTFFDSGSLIGHSLSILSLNSRSGDLGRSVYSL